MNLKIDKKQQLLYFPAFSAHQENSVDCAKFEQLQFADSSTDTKLSDTTMLEEIQRIFMENAEKKFMSKLI